jgi:hypothetical protein
VSVVDTRFTEIERQSLIDEMRVELAAFIAGGTIERSSAIGEAAALLGLRPGDLRRVAAVHLALGDAVRALNASLGSALRSPKVDTTRPVIVGQTVRGGIDWGRTIRARGASGASPTLFAVRPAQRAFDTPENRALAWTLKQLESELRRVPSASRNPATGVHNANWMGEIEGIRNSLETSMRTHWLRDIPAERPNARTLARLAASRSLFYRKTLRETIDALVDLIEAPGPKALTDLLCERYFVPERDWKLFEIVVAVRIARQLAQLASGRVDRLLVGIGRSPYAKFRIGSGEVRLWYQSWPRDSGPSSLLATARRYQMRSDPTRPDVVVEIRTGGQRYAILLELKASRSSSYLSQGIAQSLGYLHDRPDLFTEAPFAAIVCPSSSAFTPTDDVAGLDVAVVSSDEIAKWVVDRVVSTLAA